MLLINYMHSITHSQYFLSFDNHTAFSNIVKHKGKR